jgi:catechol-2,3-dioxygenase
MENIGARFAGVELYFSDLKKARVFYANTLGLQISDEDPQRYAKFSGETGFVCLERKGSESYPSQDRRFYFLRFLTSRPPSAPLGNSVLLSASQNGLCSMTRRATTFS